jgi:pSer/pThr/pTyr-binding forkhead associated (FHA) protein
MNDIPIEEKQESANDVVAEAPAAYEEAQADQVVVEARPRLVLKRAGQETDTVFEFSTPATIGRFDPSVGPVDVDLGGIEEASYVSRKHAVIVNEDGAFKIRDLGSSNGTYILRDDFQKVDEAELTDGDEVSFGNARFVFHT